MHPEVLLTGCTWCTPWCLLLTLTGGTTCTPYALLLERLQHVHLRPAVGAYVLDVVGGPGSYGAGGFHAVERATHEPLRAAGHLREGGRGRPHHPRAGGGRVLCQRHEHGPVVRLHPRATQRPRSRVVPAAHRAPPRSGAVWPQLGQHGRPPNMRWRSQARRRHPHVRQAASHGRHTGHGCGGPSSPSSHPSRQPAGCGSRSDGSGSSTSSPSRVRVCVGADGRGFAGGPPAPVTTPSCDERRSVRESRTPGTS